MYGHQQRAFLHCSKFPAYEHHRHCDIISNPEVMVALPLASDSEGNNKI